jgi:hypothetical protein
MFSPVINICQSYYDHLPHDIVQTVSQSALYSFTITLLISNRSARAGSFNLLLPIVPAGIAALTSLVHALLTPLFDGIFGDRKVKFHREIIKWFCVSACTSIIVSKLSTNKIDLVALQFFLPASVNCLLKSNFGASLEFMECVDPQAANKVRDILRPWGVLPEEGSNSIYLMGNIALSNPGLWGNI